MTNSAAELKRGSYVLYFGEAPIARVTWESEDFPTYFGRYDILPEAQAKDEAARVLRMIAADLEMSSSSEGEGDRSVEDGFVDLAESDRWWLVAPDGQRRPIRCPIFHDNNEIVWRDRCPPRRPWWRFW